STMSIYDAIMDLDSQLRNREDFMWFHSFLSFKKNMPYLISTLTLDGSTAVPLEMKLSVSTKNKSGRSAKASASQSELSASKENELSAGTENLAKLNIRFLSRAENASFYEKVESVFGQYQEKDICEAYSVSKDHFDFAKVAHGVSDTFWWDQGGDIVYVVT